MQPAHLALALPDDPRLLDRLTQAIGKQGAPPISVARSRTAVLSFECATGEMMLRSRVIQALEAVAGPDWPSLVKPLD